MVLIKGDINYQLTDNWLILGDNNLARYAQLRS